MPPPVEVVVLYAPEDAAHQAALVKHLAGLENPRVIATWSAQKIGAGQDWRKVTGEHLQAARVVVLLLTADFIASDVLDVAEKAQRAGADLIPIRVRAYDWGAVPFEALHPLPAGGTPVTLCPDRDLAWAEIAEALRHRVATATPRVAAQDAPYDLPAARGGPLSIERSAAPFLVPFLQNKGFVGREDDLARLHTLLQEGNAVGVGPAALTGMGGIGEGVVELLLLLGAKSSAPLSAVLAQRWRDEDVEAARNGARREAPVRAAEAAAWGAAAPTTYQASRKRPRVDA